MPNKAVTENTYLEAIEQNCREILLAYDEELFSYLLRVRLRAKSKTIQHQKPAFAFCGPPNTRCDRAGSRRQGKLTQKPNRAVPRMESQRSIRVLHD
jgi:hypothetical protein